MKNGEHSFSLRQNYPNPFNSETWIPYQLAEDADVTIRIYDSMGRLIRKLDLGYKPTGCYLDKADAAYWNGKNSWEEKAASGMYFYQFETGDFTAVRKMIIIE